MGFPVAAEILGHALGPTAFSPALTNANKSDGASIADDGISHTWYVSIPAMGCGWPETAAMSLSKAFQVLGVNVQALRLSILTPEGCRSIKEFGKWVGVSNGTVDRIEKGKTDPQLSHILNIAAKYQGHGIRVWQLFIEGLDPLRPPALMGEDAQKRIVEAVISATQSGHNYRSSDIEVDFHPPREPSGPTMKTVAHKRRRHKLTP